MLGTMPDALLTIGQLSRRSGVPARTIRFWSDEGLLPPTERSAGNYRRYDAAAVARLDLVRTLRELGMALDDVREVLERRRSVAEVAAAHVRAIDARMRALRVQRAICTLLADGEPTERKATIMNDLARLSAEQRQQMIDEFVDATFAGLAPDAPGVGIASAMRTMPGQLPEQPTTEQVQAWVELAELVADPGFRDRARQMALAGAEGRTPPPLDLDAIAEQGRAALETGLAPDSAGAARIVDDIVPAGTDRAGLAEMIETFSDRRVERYWSLLGVLNGWPARPAIVPAAQWFAAALHAHP